MHQPEVRVILHPEAAAAVAVVLWVLPLVEVAVVQVVVAVAVQEADVVSHIRR